MIIHHLATRADWDRRTASHYVPATLAADGFVHCSFPDQVVATETGGRPADADVVSVSDADR